MSQDRIVVRANPEGYPWAYTAFLVVSEDGEDWSVGHEDGDTPEDAIAYLREMSPRARRAVAA